MTSLGLAPSVRTLLSAYTHRSDSATKLDAACGRDLRFRAHSVVRANVSRHI